MKRFVKYLSVLCTLAVAAMPFCTVTASADTPGSASEWASGDVDLNGVVNSADALQIIRYSAGLVSLSDVQLAVADTNHDGVVNSADALATLLMSATTSKTESLSVDASMQSFANDVVELCNIERAKYGLSDLELCPELCEAAEIRVNELPIKCGHTRLDNSTWSTILSEIDYHYLTAGENVAGGIRTPAQVVSEWMKSDGHRQNILNPDYNRIGVAYTFREDSDFGYYWEQLFAGVSEDLSGGNDSIDALIEKINEMRQKNGLCKLSLDDKLTEIADIRANDITKKMDNTRPDGSNWKSLLDEYGVDYMSLSQSFCAGQQSVDDVISFYTANGSVPKFLDPEKDFHKIGLGHVFVEGDKFSHYWTIILTD